MSVPAISPDERRRWGVAGGLALAAHAAVAVMVLAWSRPSEPLPPEPVMLIELPDGGAPVAAPAAEQQPETAPEPTVAPREITPPPIDIPPVRSPLAKDPVVLPPPTQTPQPPAAPAPAQAVAPMPAAPAAPPSVATGTSASPTAGGDAKARQQEVDYFSLVSAHLNRRKVYPVEARKARQQGVVTVRFTVDRNGNVSDVSIKRSSGHEILDTATLDLVRRVAPLPKMPASMQRDSVTLSLPIDYSLRTS